MVGGFALGSQDDEMELTEGQVTPEIQPPSRDKNGRFTRKERKGRKNQSTRPVEYGIGELKEK